MSGRTFIKQWNPAVPIGTNSVRGRGRGGRKKGPDQGFVYRTVHDPHVESRHAAGRDAEGSSRFYNATRLNAAGLPLPSDRFRALTRPPRGSRGAVQQRVGMFRNAVHSATIFGNPSDRVARHSRRKIDRLMAPESDVPESVGEWRRSPSRNTQRRRDVYEYDSEENDEEEDAGRYEPRRRVSNSRRAPDKRRDPDYDPYEFRDDDSADETYQPRRSAAPRRSNSRLTVGAPSSSRAPTTYAKERLRSEDKRLRPRRLFDGAMDDDEMEERGRRPERRGDERPGSRMEKRNSKRAREPSPARAPQAAARHPVAQPYSQYRRKDAAAAGSAAGSIPQASTVRFRDQEKNEKGQKEGQKEAHYTPAIAQSIARRILSGLPPIRLKDGDGSETYLSASRSIISGALDRFMSDDQDEAEEDPPAGPDGQPPKNKNAGNPKMRSLFERTQQIDVSEGSGDEEEEDDEEGKAKGAFENIFSRHTSDDSPVLERLFDQTIRDAGGVGHGEIEEEEVDTAAMLGLGDASRPQPMQPQRIFDTGDDPFAIAPHTAGESSSDSDGHRIDPYAIPPRMAGYSSGSDGRINDPFAIAPRTAGESSGSERSSAASSVLSNLGYRNVSMAASNRSLALMTAPPPMMQQPITAGNGASSRGSGSSHYSSDQSISSISMGSRAERGFQFQMGGASNSTVPRNTNNFMHNNNDGSFNFDF